MKRKFDFGKIDFKNNGKKVNRVTIEMEYKENKNKKCFSVVGNVWNQNETDIVCGGQCLDKISEYINDPVFSEILRLWKLYHLNDMHPECEHQNAAGWNILAKKEVVLYHWNMTKMAIKQQNEVKEIIMSAAKSGRTFTPTKWQTFIINLSYSLTTWEENLSEELSEYYEPKKRLFSSDIGHTETKTLGWLRETVHPYGILSKPCPICGYKYGSDWVYFPIPEDDEKIILKLLEIGSL